MARAIAVAMVAMVLGCSGAAPAPPPSPQPTSSACVPAACPPLPSNGCGDFPDGCGGVVHCGACPAGQTCGGGGVANVCGGGSCVPEACGASCGDVPDGCGGTLHCGACPEQGGATRWLRTDGSAPELTAIAAATNRIIGVTATGDAALAMYDGAGTLLWARPDPFFEQGLRADDFEGVRLSASGRIFAWGHRGATHPPFAELLRFEPDGTSPAAIAGGSDQTTLMDVAVDAADGTLQGWNDTGDTYVLSARADGTARWRLDGVSPYNPPPSASLSIGRRVSLDPAGAAIAAGVASGRVMVQGHPAGREGARTAVVLKLDGAGRVLWARTLDEDTSPDDVRDVATSARGTVALLAGSQLLVLEGADGSTRFTRTERVPSRGRMAMDPDGQVAIAGASGCGMGVTKYNLAGELVWSRTIAPASCSGAVGATSIAIAGHDVVVSGQFRGAVDFGTGVQTAAGDQPFLLDLRP